MSSSIAPKCTPEFRKEQFGTQKEPERFFTSRSGKRIGTGFFRNKNDTERPLILFKDKLGKSFMF